MNTATSLIFTGDIGFDKYMDKRWDAPRLLGPKVLDFLLDTDHLIVNLEGPLYSVPSTSENSGVKSLVHSFNPEAASFLKSIRADIWNICNNHIMDAGPEGLSATLKEAAKAGANVLGAGMSISEASKPVILNEAGGIGMLGVGYQRACRKADEHTPGCFSWSDLPLIKTRIDEIKSQCRWCIVVAHAGEEFTALPSPYTRERFHEYLKMGADIVVCHHPHVPMNYETVGDKTIFYSLGNFVFDTDYQRSQFNTEKGILLKFDFDAQGYSFKPFGIRLDRNEGCIKASRLPLIFEDVQKDEYEKLSALSAYMFVENTKRQQQYLFPDKYKNATPEEWHENFYEPLRSGRVPGETLDFQIICPLAEQVTNNAWKQSRLDNVKRYILEQLPNFDL